MATVDVPGAYLNAINKRLIIMKMVEPVSTLMCEANPGIHDKYLIIEKGKKVLVGSAYGCPVPLESLE